MRAQFRRPGEQRGEHVELIGARGAGQHPDAPQSAVAEVPPLGQTALGPLHGVGLPVPVPAQYVQLGAQPSGLRSEQVGRLRDDQPAERPPHQSDQGGLEQGGHGDRLRPLGVRVPDSRTRNPDQPVEVIGAAARHRETPGTGREEQRRGIGRHTDAGSGRVLATGRDRGDPRSREAPAAGSGGLKSARVRKGLGSDRPGQRHRPGQRRWLPRDRLYRPGPPW